MVDSIRQPLSPVVSSLRHPAYQPNKDIVNLGCTRGRNLGLFDHYRNRPILHGLGNFAVATKAHDIFVGGSQGRVYVADHKINGLQVFDKDGSLKASISDPADLDTLEAGTSASRIAADGGGNIYAVDVAAHNLRKYVKAL